MRVLSTFTGIGGLDLAAQRCGMAVVAQSEIEPFCGKVLAHRFPGVPNLGDIRSLHASDLGAIDLLCGGFPCQDLSVAGKRAGLAGERSGLYFELVRLAAELRPRWLLFENVPGLLSSNERRDFGAVLGALGELGYGYAWRVLDAQFFGVPQRRRRVLIVGCLGDASRAAAVLFESASCARHPAPSCQAGTRAAHSLGASARGTGDGHGNAWNTDYVTPTLLGGGSTPGAHGKHSESDRLPLVAATLNSGGNSGGFRTEPGQHLALTTVSAITTRSHTAEGHDASEDGTGRGTPLLVCGGSDPILAEDLSFPLTTRRADQTAMAWDLAQITSPDNRANPKPGDPAPPLNQKGQLSLGVRRLMPVECERLQGFPDAWTCLRDHPQQCDCPDSPRYRALGNAVAVPVIEWVLSRMAAVHSESLAEAA